MRARSKSAGWISSGIAAGLVLAALPASPAAAAQVVPRELFGQHVSRISAGVPAGLSAGSIRLWDSGVSWNQLEPADNDYNWAPLDAALTNAAAMGVSEVLYTLGGTPGWAASDPNSKGGLYGAGTNSPPKSDSLAVDFVTALLKHANGKIKAVQVWNEANLPDFYNGTPQQMAAMTKAVAPAIRAGGARVVAASTTVRASGPTKTWGKNYGKAMKSAGAWSSVDAVAGHFYPPAKNGPSTRVSYIKALKKYYKKWGAGGKPMWDTEMNYGDTRSYMPVKRTYTGATGATYVARTYIDSQRYGLQRVFWYGWDIHVLGTDMTVRPLGEQKTEAGEAFIQIQEWMAGNTWYGCKVKSKVTRCKLSTPSGTKQSIVYGAKSKAYKVPAGTTAIKDLAGGSKAVSAGQSITLTTQPILLVGAA